MKYPVRREQAEKKRELTQLSTLEHAQQVLRISHTCSFTHTYTAGPSYITYMQFQQVNNNKKCTPNNGFGNAAKLPIIK